MKRKTRLVFSVMLFLLVSPALASKNPDRKLESSTEVYQKLLNAPDRGVPEALLDKCKCVVVIPHVIKAALGYGGRHGTGVVSCRNDQNDQ